MGAVEVMGAAPERHIPDPNESARQGFGPRNPRPMGSSESPKISLVNTAQKAPAWTRNLFTLDVGFHGLMLGAALTVLAVVGPILSGVLQRSALAVVKVWFHFFWASSPDPVSRELRALPVVF